MLRTSFTLLAITISLLVAVLVVASADSFAVADAKLDESSQTSQSAESAADVAANVANQQSVSAAVLLDPSDQKPLSSNSDKPSSVSSHSIEHAAAAEASATSSNGATKDPASASGDGDADASPREADEPSSSDSLPASLSSSSSRASATPSSSLQFTTNYASAFLGARVVQAHAGAIGAHNILNDDSRKYLLTPCSLPRKFFTVQLAREVQVTMVMLQSKEYFCAFLRDFVLLGSTSFPCQGDGCSWRHLGRFTANFSREKQYFYLDPGAPPVRFIRLLWLTHHGDERSCTLSHFHAFGFDVLESFVQASSAATAEQQQQQQENEEKQQQQIDDEEEEQQQKQKQRQQQDQQRVDDQEQKQNEDALLSSSVPLEESILTDALFSDLHKKLSSSSSSSASSVSTNNTLAPHEAVVVSTTQESLQATASTPSNASSVANPSISMQGISSNNISSANGLHNATATAFVPTVRMYRLQRPPTTSCGAIYSMNQTNHYNNNILPQPPTPSVTNNESDAAAPAHATVSQHSNEPGMSPLPPAAPTLRIILDCCECVSSDSKKKLPSRWWGNASVDCDKNKLNRKVKKEMTMPTAVTSYLCPLDDDEKKKKTAAPVVEFRCDWICVPPVLTSLTRAPKKQQQQNTSSSSNSNNNATAAKQQKSASSKPPHHKAHGDRTATSSSAMSEQHHHQDLALRYAKIAAAGNQLIAQRYQKSVDDLRKSLGGLKKELQLARTERNAVMLEQQQRMDRLERRLQALGVEFEDTKSQLEASKANAKLVLGILCFFVGSIFVYAIFSAAIASSSTARQSLAKLSSRLTGSYNPQHPSEDRTSLSASSSLSLFDKQPENASPGRKGSIRFQLLPDSTDTTPPEHSLNSSRNGHGATTTAAASLSLNSNNGTGVFSSPMFVSPLFVAGNNHSSSCDELFVAGVSPPSGQDQAMFFDPQQQQHDGNGTIAGAAAEKSGPLEPSNSDNRSHSIEDAANNRGRHRSGSIDSQCGPDADAGDLM